MSKIGMIKKIVGMGVSFGVGAIVNNIIKSTTPKSIGTFKKVCIGLGAFALGSMISDKAVKYTEDTIDNGINEVKKMVSNGDLN